MKKVAIQRSYGENQSSWKRVFELNSFEVESCSDHEQFRLLLDKGQYDLLIIELCPHKKVNNLTSLLNIIKLGKLAPPTIIILQEDMCMLYRSDLKEFVKRRFFNRNAKIISKPFVVPDLISESIDLLDNSAQFDPMLARLY